ncbi:hypothetical protein, partial [Pseudomonas aeruginosa]|uniref:hypothetical protein n=1 Tax=Pseudomonas aeruginosa TaxID=287 RepID=UPI00300B0C8C
EVLRQLVCALQYGLRSHSLFLYQEANPLDEGLEARALVLLIPLLVKNAAVGLAKHPLIASPAGSGKSP